MCAFTAAGAATGSIICPPCAEPPWGNSLSERSDGWRAMAWSVGTKMVKGPEVRRPSAMPVRSSAEEARESWGSRAITSTQVVDCAVAPEAHTTESASPEIAPAAKRVGSMVVVSIECAVRSLAVPARLRNLSFRGQEPGR